MTTIYDEGSYRTEVSVPSFGDGGVQRLFAPMKRDPEASGTQQGCIIFTEPDEPPDPEKAPTPIHELIYCLFPDREAEAS
jgi:hypothetical protein